MVGKRMCNVCKGTGSVEGLPKYESCFSCNGVGRIKSFNPNDLLGGTKCMTCGGTGSVKSFMKNYLTCISCNGVGYFNY